MPKDNGYKLTQGEYAKHRGISQSMVAKLVRQGKLKGAFKKEGRRYLINPKKADAILSAIVDPAKSKQKTVSFAEAARREKLAKAALLELKLKRERGELVQRERVEAVAAKLATLVRVGIEAIPAKVAPTVAGMTAPGDVARFIEREVKTVLNSLAKEITDLDL
jgi:hypothetical protein